jgi:hypothetical protein
MAYQSASVLKNAVAKVAVAAVTAAVAVPSAAYAVDGPRLVEKTLYTSDIQYRFQRSPDNKTLSVVFDNLGVALSPQSAGPAIRVFPLRIPVADASKGATLRIKARGKLTCPAGTACLGILWVNGQTQVLKPSRGKTSSGIVAEAEFSLPGAEVHQAAVMLIADRTTKKGGCAAAISLGSLDLTIAPPPAEAGSAKK